jgi:adenine-specific DNA-methyltransferase
LKDENGKLKTATPTSFFDGPYTHEGTKEIDALFGTRVYTFPKPSNLVKQLIQCDINGSEDKDFWVLDFFAGSGTTAHAVLKLNSEDGGNRKYILVEMADYFDTVMKPRIEKLMFSLKWKNGLPVMNKGVSHMFKYMYLEQYEDTLNSVVFRTLDRTVQETLETFGDYFVRYMLDNETNILSDKFVKPFDYKIRTIESDGEKSVGVDLVETFNNLLGLTVEKLQRLDDDERIYRVVFGKLENKSVCVIWRDTDQLDLEKDKAFIENKILAGKGFDLIYANGDSYVKNARPLEPEFKRLMGA